MDFKRKELMRIHIKEVSEQIFGPKKFIFHYSWIFFSVASKTKTEFIEVQHQIGFLIAIFLL